MRDEDTRATLTLMAGLAAATITGYLREAALAYRLGATRSADIYLVAFSLPEFFLIAAPIVLTPAFLPLFAEQRLQQGEQSAWRFARQAAAALASLLLVATAVLAATAPGLMRWLVPGLDPAAREEAARALTRMLPALSLIGVATLAGAALQAYRRFACPALAKAIYNLTFVAALLFLPLTWPVGGAAWGVTLGAAATLLAQAAPLWRHRPARSDRQAGEPVKPDAGAVAAFARLAAPLAAGYAVHHLILFVDRAMATTAGVGSVAALNYGYRLALVVGQLSGAAVSTALFPRMAEQAAQGDLSGLRASLSGAQRFVWAIGLPACTGLILLRRPLVQLLFERGAFDGAATAAVSSVLAWYALAVLTDALCQPLWRAVYAWRMSGAVVAVNALQTGLRFLANLALIRPLGYNGLALSAALGLAVQLAVLGWLVHRRLGSGAGQQPAWRQSYGSVVVAAAPAAAVMALAARWLAAPPLVVLLAGGGLGGLAYLGILKWLKRQRV